MESTTCPPVIFLEWDLLQAREIRVRGEIRTPDDFDLPFDMSYFGVEVFAPEAFSLSFETREVDEGTKQQKIAEN
ncbi:hypothetical protein SADUNF_Sadunf16G0120900 [Salix dunnii]|uniref:Uncharacterized protein n=1 Tax=Salix dunnii TaxID=1413687 RepID=A0A835MLK6_9ROSI|nr:hypothetical protein SADUNF_Sadunf16G0120900 [Salix dunnii]